MEGLRDGRGRNKPEEGLSEVERLKAEKAEVIHDKHPDMGYRRIGIHSHMTTVSMSMTKGCSGYAGRKKQSYIKHRYNCCTKPAPDPAYVAESILDREFRSDMPNEKWVTDVSGSKYGTREEDKKGKLYLSVILDLCGNRPVAFEYGDHNDNQIVFKTFDKAITTDPDAKPIFHSDRDTSIPLKLSGRRSWMPE